MAGFRKRLYMMNQKALLLQIKKELEAEGVKYEQDMFGNIWSIQHPGKPCFVSHCDTVMSSPLGYHSPLIIERGVVSREGDYILGADDRAGVNIILNHKHHINFVFTVDEEIGCLGAQHLAKNEDFILDCEDITFFCELDRKGSCDCLGNIHGYCDEELATKICDVLNYKDTWGILTDIDEFIDICQGVNISVGYYEQHTTKEYLVLEEWEYINSMIPEINKIEIEPRTYENDELYNYGTYWGDEYPITEKCPMCGKFKSPTNFIGGMCSECYDKTIVEVDENHICSVCKKHIPHGEIHCFIPIYDISICQDCYSEVATMPDEDVKEILEGDDK